MEYSSGWQRRPSDDHSSTSGWCRIGLRGWRGGDEEEREREGGVGMKEW